MYVTIGLLRYWGARCAQVERFASDFPHGVEVTEALCVLNAEHYDWDWAARLLPPLQQWKYHRFAAEVAAEAHGDAAHAKACAFGRLAEEASLPLSTWLGSVEE